MVRFRGVSVEFGIFFWVHQSCPGRGQVRLNDMCRLARNVNNFTVGLNTSGTGPTSLEGQGCFGEE